MKKKIALALLLSSMLSMFILNFGQASRNIAAGTGDYDDLPIELHIIHIKWTS